MTNSEYVLVGGLFNGIETVPQYADWMKGLLTFVPDGSYDLVSTTWNEETRQVVVTCICLSDYRECQLRHH